MNFIYRQISSDKPGLLFSGPEPASYRLEEAMEGHKAKRKMLRGCDNSSKEGLQAMFQYPRASPEIPGKEDVPEVTSAIPACPLAVAHL